MYLLLKQPVTTATDQCMNLQQRERFLLFLSRPQSKKSSTSRYILVKKRASNQTKLPESQLFCPNEEDEDAARSKVLFNTREAPELALASSVA